MAIDQNWSRGISPRVLFQPGIVSVLSLCLSMAEPEQGDYQIRPKDSKKFRCEAVKVGEQEFPKYQLVMIG